MDFITIEELASAAGKSRRTVDRRLLELQKNDPEKFQKLTKPQGSKNRILYSPLLLALFGISPAIVEEVQQEIVEELKPPKRQKKAQTSPGPRPTIIRLDGIPEKEKKDFEVMHALMEDYKTGLFSLPECCTRNNITVTTFFFWINNRPEFHDLYSEAYKVHKKSFAIYIRELGKDSLKKLITGYDKELQSTTYEQKISPQGQEILIPKERRVQVKHVLPNVNAITFGLTNKDPNDWRVRMGNQLPTKEPEQDQFEKMTDAELDAYLEEAQQKGLLPQNTQNVNPDTV